MWYHVIMSEVYISEFGVGDVVKYVGPFSESIGKCTVGIVLSDGCPKPEDSEYEFIKVKFGRKVKTLEVPFHGTKCLAVVSAAGRS